MSIEDKKDKTKGLVSRSVMLAIIALLIAYADYPVEKVCDDYVHCSYQEHIEERFGDWKSGLESSMRLGIMTSALATSASTYTADQGRITYFSNTGFDEGFWGE